VISAATFEKGRRLRGEDRIRRLHEGVYVVAGDHGTYLVAVASPVDVVTAVAELEVDHPVASAVCSCPADGVCAHMVAVGLDLRPAGAAL
jgi:uncharacterized Zn finger protein